MEHIDQNILWAYIIDDIEPKNIEIIKHHLDVCPTCKYEYDVQVKLHNELYEINEDKPSLDFSKNIVNKLEKSIKIEKANQFWLKFTKSALICAIIISIILPLTILITQRVEFNISNGSLHKITLQILSTCSVLWMLYGIDIFFKRAYTK